MTRDGDWKVHLRRFALVLMMAAWLGGARVVPAAAVTECDDYYDCDYLEVCYQGVCQGCNADPNQCDGYWDLEEGFCNSEASENGLCFDCSDCLPLGCDKANGYCFWCGSGVDCPDDYGCQEGLCIYMPKPSR